MNAPTTNVKVNLAIATQIIADGPFNDNALTIDAINDGSPTVIPVGAFN